jgi:ribA/ribD-fused uncharacterized protein
MQDSPNTPIYFYTRSMPFFELSNFCPPGLEADGAYWTTVEHYFQAQKFKDSAFRERIRRATTPKDARELGRSREYPIRPDWDEIRESVMLTALRRKFSKGPARELLLSTGDHPMVEASPLDYFWGAGQNGTGLNRLGHLSQSEKLRRRYCPPESRVPRDVVTWIPSIAFPRPLPNRA